MKEIYIVSSVCGCIKQRSLITILSRAPFLQIWLAGPVQRKRLTCRCTCCVVRLDAWVKIGGQCVENCQVARMTGAGTHIVICKYCECLETVVWGGEDEGKKKKSVRFEKTWPPRSAQTTCPVPYCFSEKIPPFMWILPDQWLAR